MNGSVHIYLLVVALLFTACDAEQVMTGEMEQESTEQQTSEHQPVRTAGIDESRFSDEISIWNDEIRGVLESKGIDLDPGKVDEASNLATIEQLEEALQTSVVADHFEVNVFTHGNLGQRYFRLAEAAHREGNRSEADSLWNISVDYHRRVVDLLEPSGDGEENRFFLAYTYNNLAQAYMRLERFQDAMDLIAVIVEEHQDLDVGGPYESWFSVKYGVNLLHGMTRTFFYQDLDELDRDEVTEGIDYLNEIADRYENEVGFAAARNLHRHYFITEDRDGAEEAYFLAVNLLEKLDHLHPGEEWETWLGRSRIQQEFERRGWEYGLIE